MNKKITDIQYNYLNLPSRIQFEDGNSISYLYDANGSKLHTTHIMDGDTLNTDYWGNAIYENGVLDKLMTGQGYITLADTTYHYFLQDHQGNNRVIVNQNGAVEEVNHYYPFGGVFASTQSVQPFKYNGKELDRRNGLDWYDYGARHYDAALGRWHAMDPKSEKYYGISPYVYCNNNPVKNIDLDGRDWYMLESTGELYFNKPFGALDILDVLVTGGKKTNNIERNNITYKPSQKGDKASNAIGSAFEVMSTITSGKHDYRSINTYNNWNDYSKSTGGSGRMLNYKNK